MKAVLDALVLDNSVTMRWCFQNATHAYAEGVLQTLAAAEAIVPILWRYEVTAVLAKSQRDGIITGANADAFLAALQSFNITVDRDGADYILTNVYRLAVAYRLTAYDAAYLELARRKNLPLATLDDELIRACKLTGHALL